MAEIENKPAAPKPRRRIGRTIGIIALLCVVGIVVIYFVATSGPFFKSVILPRVAKSLNADITVANANIHPFSEVTLDNVRVQTTGTEPLLTAQRVHVRYDLRAILSGNNVVQELLLDQPMIHLVRETNGSSNLDPLLKRSGAKKAKQPQNPARLDLENLAIKNGTIDIIQKTTGPTNHIELRNLDVQITRVQNGQSGKVTLGSDFQMRRFYPPGPTNQPNDVLAGKLSGAFDFALDPQLSPSSVNGKTELAFSQTAGAYKDFANYSGLLEIKLTPTEIQQLALSLQQGGQNLGRILINGPFDPAKMEGKLNVAVQSIDRHLLNLVGATHGWDFSDSQLNSSNVVQIGKKGKQVAVAGQLIGRQVSVKQTAQTTPVLDLDLNYDVDVNLEDKTAQLRQLRLAAKQNQADLLLASLDQPMGLSWGQGAPGFAESALNLSVTNLNLSDWAFLMGTNPPTGRLNLQTKLVAQNNGRTLKTDIAGQINDLALKVGTNDIKQSQLTLSANGSVENLNRIALDQFRFALAQQNQTVADGQGTAQVVLGGGKDIHVDAQLNAILPALLQQFPVANLEASQGSLKATANYTQTADAKTASGNAQLRDFTGRYGAYNFKNYQTAVDYNVALESDFLKISKATVALSSQGKSGGAFDLAGKYRLENKSGQITFKAIDVNQNGLEPFLGSALGEKKLLSVALNGVGSADFTPKQPTQLKADFAVTNLVVQEPNQPAPNPPLSARFQLDGSLLDQSMELRQTVLTLSPTARAKNQLSVQGHVDLSTNNPAPGQLSIRSDAFDLTEFYDLFASKKVKATPATTATAPAPATTTTAAPAQPAGAAHLPVRQLSTDLQIGHLYLREIDAADVRGTAVIQTNQVSLQPFSMQLNGAPMRLQALIDLGVPGYGYDLTLGAERIPLQPLVNSFSAQSNKLRGDLTAHAQIKGVGTTGASLQKTLAGQMDLVTTNLNLEIVGPKIRRLLEPIALVLQLPELMQTPIDWIAANANMGDGQIQLTNFVVQSAAFVAQSRGAIPIEDPLTNSRLKLPVEFSLRRALAAKINLVRPNTPTNLVYVQLPTFVTLAGTVGNPETKVNKLALSGLLLESVGGIDRLGGDKGKVLQGIGGLLSGQGAQGGTNQPGTNTAINPFDLFKKQPKQTNAPPSTKKQRVNPFDLLNNVLTNR